MFDRNQVIKLRKSRDLTQLEFARRIGTSRNVIGNWEAGDSKPGADMLDKISREFLVSVSFFFNGD